MHDEPACKLRLGVKVRGLDEVVQKAQFFPPEVRAALLETITADVAAYQIWQASI
jgi:hypothetical protein